MFDLNTSERPLAERATYSPHAVEKYGPWFPNELLLRLREDEIVSNQLSSARITEEMPQIDSLLRRIDTEYGGDAPRDRGDEVGAEAGELEAKVEPVAEDGDTLKYDIVISKDKSQWRFKYYPPQWTPGTRFGASASLGLLLGGTAFLLRRHRLNFNKGEHYTTFDFIVKKTSPEF